MTNWNQFEQRTGGTPIDCEVCEAMLLDAVDGTLTAGEQAAFTRHLSGCVACTEQFAEAQRGAAWMDMLKVQKPEPPADLLARILAETTGQTTASQTAPGRVLAMPVSAAPVAAPVMAPAQMVPVMAAPAAPGRVLVFRRKVTTAFSFNSGYGHFQPRLAMTAAMAFFSIALTMNLGGVRLSDLRPSAIHRTLADVRANAARTFQNSRVVYQVESQLKDLRNDERGGPEQDLGGPFAAPGSGDAAPRQQPAAPRQQQESKPQREQVPQGSSVLTAPAVNKGDGTIETQAATTNDLRLQEGA